MSVVSRYGIFGVDVGSKKQILICEIFSTFSGAEDVRSDLKKAGYRKLKIKLLGAV